MAKCSICGNEAFFKVKGEHLYYCREHAEEFFSLDYLEKVDPISISNKEASLLKEFVEKNN